MMVSSHDEARAWASPQAAHVIFDFDLTLFPEESTLGLAKAAVRHHSQSQRLLDFLEQPGSRRKSLGSGLQGLSSLLSILFSIRKSVIADYCERSASRLEPEFIALLARLRQMDVGVHIISSGYTEVVTRLAGALGVGASNIAANEFAWWRENAIGVRPSVLHGTHGKIKTIRRWQASGRLSGPFIMVGDGSADRKVFEHGLAHGFIQADYYRPAASPSLPGNFRVAETPQQLPPLLYAMLEEMRGRGSAPPTGRNAGAH